MAKPRPRTPELRRLIKFVDAFRDRRIAVLGDFMLDEFIWGRVSRVSPEAPVPVVDVTDQTAALGGAGNVVANIVAMGGRPFPFGVLGRDAAGERLRAMLRAQSTPLSGLVADARRHTTVKTRIIEVSRKHQVVRADRESRGAVSAEVGKQLARRLLRDVRSFHAVVVSDYDKGAVTPELLAEVLPALHAAKVPVFLDPRTRNPESYSPVTAITPNEREAERISGIEISSDADLVRAGERILDMLDCSYVLITRGERGMALFERGGSVRHIATVAREVYDVTGAGDTVIATLALAFSAGAPMFDAAIVANCAAGLAVAHVGTVAPTAEELRAAINARVR